MDIGEFAKKVFDKLRGAPDPDEGKEDTSEFAKKFHATQDAVNKAVSPHTNPAASWLHEHVSMPMGRAVVTPVINATLGEHGLAMRELDRKIADLELQKEANRGFLPVRDEGEIDVVVKKAIDNAKKK